VRASILTAGLLLKSGALPFPVAAGILLAAIITLKGQTTASL
jgi:hypothetical protein